MPTEAPALPIALDAKGVIERLFPSIGLRTWRRLDACEKCPAAFNIGQRKLWRVADLQRWAEAGFPDRKTFEGRAGK